MANPNAPNNQLQAYTSPFAKLKSTGPTKSLSTTIIKIGHLNNSNTGANAPAGIIERLGTKRVELEYVGDFGKIRLTNLASDFIHKHCNSTKNVIKTAVNSAIFQSSMNYQKMKFLQAQAQINTAQANPRSKQSDFEPRAVRMIIRINAPLSRSEIEEEYKSDRQPSWHLDTNLYPPTDLTDVNSIYAATFVGKPTYFIRSLRTLPPSLQPTVQTFRDNHQDPEDPENVKMLNQALRKAHLQPENYLEKVEVGDIIRFSWGQDDSVLHASGNRDLGRIIVLMLFGSRVEINRGDIGYRKH